MNRRKLGLVGISALAAATMSVAASAQDITIASAGPMTGQYAAFGQQLKRGAEMAVADINARGGVLGRKLKLEIGDDACDPKQAVAVANQLATKKVAFVAGHFCSSSSIPASQVYNESGILQITPASTNPRLTDEAAQKGWNNVFRTCGRDDAQGTIAGRWLASNYKGKKVAIIHDKSTYGKGLADETKKAMNAAGLREAMYEAITQGDKDFTALISKMKQAGVDVIYHGGYHTEAGLMVRQAREQGFGAVFVSGDALVDNEYWKITGPAGQGTIMTFAPDPRNAPTAKGIVEKFKAQGFDPEGYTLYTYAAIQVWAAAAEKAKSIDAGKLAAQIHGNKFSTVIGDLQYDKKGDVSNSKYVFYIWNNGEYKEEPSLMGPRS
ncbi:MAG: branched-chain amino acid ABC transporter substrate-binding protein [Alphaproteobacteria bacterium]|nr:branched-chain amino acid ABC transporter substrate-binding protein [Alphaproteobacteria bacterium]